ncbi:MAG: hypothetical protein LBI33_14345 [Propionibacteriaceae bacterium]|nr:hypothetical protein [Propionibacteriaceae bacterium]
MRKFAVTLISCGLLLLTGCTVQRELSSSPGESQWSLACQAPDSRTLAMIEKQVAAIEAKAENGSTGAYENYGPSNPTVVQFADEWEIISFGWGWSTTDVYLARTDSADPSAWLLVEYNDTELWDQPSVPRDVLAQAQDAAKVAAPCVMGG